LVFIDGEGRDRLPPRTMSELKRFFSNSLIVFLSTLLTTAVNAGIFLYLANSHLTLSEFGQFAYALSVTAIVAAVTEYGVEPYYIRALSSRQISFSEVGCIWGFR